MGTENDIKTNSSKMKSIIIIQKKKMNKLELFCQNKKCEVFSTTSENGLTEIKYLC